MTAPAASQLGETPTDASLLERVVEGSTEAFASLYDRHADVVYAVAMRTTRDHGRAADIVQETFLALWDRAELFDPNRGSLRGWLSAIARNRAIDQVRHASRHDRALAFSSLATAKATTARSLNGSRARVRRSQWVLPILVRRPPSSALRLVHRWPTRWHHSRRSSAR